MLENVRSFFTRLWKDESAEITVEYGLLVAVVAIGLVAVFTLFRQGISDWFTAIVARIQAFPA